MITSSEIAAGTARLTAGKLKADDRLNLASAFRLYLKNLSGFDDLSDRLASAEDSVDGKKASFLAAILISLEDNGFDMSELQGGRSGLKTNEAGSLNLKIRFGLTLLGYKLPETFTGGVQNADETLVADFKTFSGVTLDRTGGW